MAERCDWDHSSPGIRQIKSMAEVLKRLTRIMPENLWEFNPDKREEALQRLIGGRYEELIELHAEGIAKTAISRGLEMPKIHRTLISTQRNK